MLRYDWSRPVWRLFWGALVSAGMVIARHTRGRFSVLPTLCNFDLAQDLLVFSEFFLGCCLLEAVNWVVWYTQHRRELREARRKPHDPEDYTLSGGGILGTENKTAAFLLGCGFIALGVTVGPNPCASQASMRLSWISVVATLGAAYGMLLWGSLVAS